MPRAVLVLGNAVYDFVVRTVEEIAWNTSHWVDAIEPRLGGNGASTAAAAASLGVPVRLISAVGQDAFGNELVDQLRRAGVDVSGVARLNDPTPATVALVSESGERMLLHRPGLALTAFASTVDLPLAGFSHFHLANPFALPHIRRQAVPLLKQARDAGLRTSLDTGWDSRGRWMEDLEPCLPLTDYWFSNQRELEKLTGEADVTAAAAWLRIRGVGTVIAKLGASGCAVFTAEGANTTPAFPTIVVDTTGAGDVFVGTFLAALERGCDLPRTARLANAAAARSVQRLGAIEGLVSWEELISIAG